MRALALIVLPALAARPYRGGVVAAHPLGRGFALVPLSDTSVGVSSTDGLLRKTVFGSSASPSQGLNASVTVLIDSNSAKERSEWVELKSRSADGPPSRR